MFISCPELLSSRESDYILSLLYSRVKRMTVVSENEVEEHELN